MVWSGLLLVCVAAGNGDNLGKHPHNVHKKSENIFSPHASHWKSIGEYTKVYVDFFPTPFQGPERLHASRIFFLL
jgi:hypothetical protein